MITVRNRLSRPLCLDLGNKETLRLLAKGKKEIRDEQVACDAIQQSLDMDYITISKME